MLITCVYCWSFYLCTLFVFLPDVVFLLHFLLYTVIAHAYLKMPFYFCRNIFWQAVPQMNMIFVLF